MTENELSTSLDDFTTSATRSWLVKWLKDNPKVILSLPLKNGQALMKEANTHRWVNQVLVASSSFKSALQMLEHGTTTIPQVRLETQIYEAILPLVESAGL